MLPSATGRVSSNTVAFVKLRMLKLSSHFSGHACSFPSCRYSTRTFRANMLRFKHRIELDAAPAAPHSVTLCISPISPRRTLYVLVALDHSGRSDRRLGRRQDHEGLRLRPAYRYIALGIVGAIVGGWLVRLLGFEPMGGLISSIVTAIIGAIVLIAIARAIKKA